MESFKALILTVGLPRSGKSTWARKFIPFCPVVNPDSIRLALYGSAFVPSAEKIVWAHTDLMIRSLFLYGHSFVILDATNTTRQQREQWISPQWKTWYKIFSTKADICMDRAREEGNEGLLQAIARMSAEFEVASILHEDVVAAPDEDLFTMMRVG